MSRIVRARESGQCTTLISNRKSGRQRQDGTKKKLRDACAFRRVPMHIMEAGLLDRACGREGRMAASLKKGGICDQILQIINQTEEPLT